MPSAIFSRSLDLERRKPRWSAGLQAVTERMVGRQRR